MKKTILLNRLTACALVLLMLVSMVFTQMTAFAITPFDLDLSVLSGISTNTSVNEETYSYTWTVEEIGGETVRTVELILDGANIKTLTLPCYNYGKLHVIIDTKSDSYIEEICESYVSGYSYQWNSLIFKGDGKLEIEYMNIQGGSNNHEITVSEGSSVGVVGEYANLSFGGSGNSNSSANIYGALYINGNIGCGSVKIGKNGSLTCKRVCLSGIGAFDSDQYANAFVIENGGKLYAIGDTNWSDNETGEYYAALVVFAQIEDGEPSAVMSIPNGYLPENFTIKKVDNYVTVDNDDDKRPAATMFDMGVIYAATTLTLETLTEKYTISFDTNGGSEIADVTVNDGDKLEQPSVPSKSGHTFSGWYKDSALTEPYNFETAVTSSFTLYAKWIKNNVNDLLETDEHFAYIKGYDDKTVKPENNITRAETAEVFFRLLDKELKQANLTDTNSFDDVNKNSWYNASVSVLEKLGIIKGKKTGEFAPNTYITRAEFAVICARFDDSDFETEAVFSDIKGHWAENEILEAVAHGWIEGYENGTFRPNSYISRAEAMTFINRMLERTPKSADDLHEDMIKWSDNSDKNAWYYVAVQEATNDHVYAISSDGNEKWTEIKAQ